MDTTTSVQDPIRLRALAHPLRMRLLGLLRIEGPATASGLAKRLGESSGSTSYHLRQLARHGFIEPAPELNRGRERWWRSAHQATVMQPGDFSESPESQLVANAYQHQVLQAHTTVAAHYIDEQETWSREWNDAAELNDLWVRLTPESLSGLMDGIQELIEAADVPDNAEDEDVERVAVIFHAVPVRELRL